MLILVSTWSGVHEVTDDVAACYFCCWFTCRKVEINAVTCKASISVWEYTWGDFLPWFFFQYFGFFGGFFFLVSSVACVPYRTPFQWWFSDAENLEKKNWLTNRLEEFGLNYLALPKQELGHSSNHSFIITDPWFTVSVDLLQLNYS